jgi:glutamyl endopeptidase
MGRPIRVQDPPEMLVPSVVDAAVQFTATATLAHPHPPHPSYIFAPDERTQVANTQLMPYRAIGLIEFTGTDGGPYSCTGFLYEHNTVATAAHCMYTKEPQHGPDGFVRNVFVSFGRNGGTLPFGRCRARQLTVPTRWIDDRDWEFDWAIVKIELGEACRLGLQPSLLTLSGIQPIDYGKPVVAQMSGYSADKPFGTQWFRQGSMTVYQGTRRISHALDVVGGDSGAPVYRSLTGCAFCVYALQSSQSDSLGQVNYATHLTDDVLRVYQDYGARIDDFAQFLPLSRK